MTLRFCRPSARRVLGSILAVTAVICALIGVALYVWALLGYRDDPHPTTGECTRVFVMLMTVYGPGIVVNLWWISAPVILVIAAFVAMVHREPVPETDSSAGSIGDKDIREPTD